MRRSPILHNTRLDLRLGCLYTHLGAAHRIPFWKVASLIVGRVISCARTHVGFVGVLDGEDRLQ